MTDGDRKDLEADMVELLKKDRPRSLAALQALGTDQGMSTGRYQNQMERIIGWLEAHYPASTDFEWIELEDIIEDAAQGVPR